MKKLLLYFLIAILSEAAYCQIPSGLIACYPFNGNANDLSGNNHNGTVMGPVLTSDRFGNVNSAYQYDGINDFIDLGLFADFTESNNFTISAWIQPNQVLPQTILMLQPDDFNDRLNAMAYYSHNGVSSTFWDFGNCTMGGRLSEVGTIFSNTWQHFVFTVDQNAGMKVYKNGNLVNVLLTSSQVVDRNRNLQIGGAVDWVGAPFYFEGKIDDMSLYDREITAAEVLILYNNNSLCQTTAISENSNNPLISVSALNNTMHVEIGEKTAGVFYLTSADGKLIYKSNQLHEGDVLNIPIEKFTNRILIYSFISNSSVTSGKFLNVE
jgi:hypothetical protein